MKGLQEQFMKENPTKITASERFPKLEPKLEEENLVNAEMVGATGKRGHKYSFVYQGKVVSFLSTQVFVKDVNNLLVESIDNKKSYKNLKELFNLADAPSGL